VVGPVKRGATVSLNKSLEQLFYAVSIQFLLSLLRFYLHKPFQRRQWGSVPHKLIGHVTTWGWAVQSWDTDSSAPDGLNSRRACDHGLLALDCRRWAILVSLEGVCPNKISHGCFHATSGSCQERSGRI